MKPYGVKVIECPDVGDIQEMGSKSRIGRYPGRGGDYHGYNRNPEVKARTRRYWARKARRASSQAVEEES